VLEGGRKRGKRAEEREESLYGPASLLTRHSSSLLPIRYKGNVVIKYRFPGREAVAKKVSVADHTSDIILTPDGK